MPLPFLVIDLGFISFAPYANEGYLGLLITSSKADSYEFIYLTKC